MPTFTNNHFTGRDSESHVQLSSRYHNLIDDESCCQSAPSLRRHSRYCARDPARTGINGSGIIFFRVVSFLRPTRHRWRYLNGVCTLEVVYDNERNVLGTSTSHLIAPPSNFHILTTRFSLWVCLHGGSQRRGKIELVLGRAPMTEADTPSYSCIIVMKQSSVYKIQDLPSPLPDPSIALSAEKGHSVFCNVLEERRCVGPSAGHARSSSGGHRVWETLGALQGHGKCPNTADMRMRKMLALPRITTRSALTKINARSI
ncbi:hypothetical protein B0H16DRAFT_1473111 [Mycena metata]|uniref:Uncharacterized protein n=1 Tax=Mycena metata TaxID=1033252 RepID=A0AAD7MLE9_9AGAR|nr:hypothetical protein B0H16DRAFT_1473111 [Mycena metata]